MSQLLHVEIPNFGATVLGSLNEQRLLGHYCDVSILVKGRAFKAHRAVLAASSLYFRDLFSSSTKSQFELPSSVTPACFEQILTFCYTGKLTMATSEQLVVMYTAGYLQIQHIVERGMDLMFKANSPHCDSQTAGSLEETGSEPQSPCNNGNGLAVAALLGTTGWSPSLLMSRKIKLEGGEPTPLTTSLAQSRLSSSELGSRLARASSLLYTTAGGTAIHGLPSYHLQGAGGGGTGVERSSPGASSLPTTDSPTSYQNEDEEFEEEPYDGITEDSYSHLYGRSANPYGIQDKPEMAAMPLALESRNCVLIRRDLVALPASLISQIGYRCHPKLYTEGDPGEKLELVAGTQVFMTRGQLMNCHLCAGIKHKVLLRRLLATFFDRNTLANSCGTGIRSSTSDPSRKPLDSRVLNAVKLYCQNFNPNFKESEMNVIAADMCTNARRVRKRWLPKIKSMLPDGMDVYRAGMGMGAAVGLGLAMAAPQPGVALPFEPDFKALDQRLYPDRKDPLRTHLPLADSSPGCVAAGAEAEGEGEGVVQEDQGEDEEDAGLEGADGSMGAPTSIPGAEAGNCGDTPPEQEVETFGQGLRVNGQ
ncbi:nucleus accumbens-associated protein 2 [Pseudoliparis swirei]|uniref:nucleus accumbens-associated protein 2 n=1 Tax=Pseudoliparis swirei TaxID=2059687 RepID=UPI0024BF0C91|nr:nucleus accumbens-associated protein 2 [Pseudoliparis swirei]XP_056289339.1 nucleus accumbens-associated protein 2 [Pseudoliparis swirei]XP_056289340.1 nucleus accumbens-associated protein 2 [Pseudoliparis swirei]XP_056289341.1 nucleus accumbens-associated protein 2 [Pseudoliparis swirei]XP_056289342.1 nucleus accumbens-associated protein 2 [Pseudoliparis swirei]XP_056289343.1 nucleus accumbens-associated protein 2 [Pseudoliparis swirei]XP_056289344.1 nucleus accumbens-associated protein 2